MPAHASRHNGSFNPDLRIVISAGYLNIAGPYFGSDGLLSSLDRVQQLQQRQPGLIRKPPKPSFAFNQIGKRLPGHTVMLVQHLHPLLGIDQRMHHAGERVHELVIACNSTSEAVMSMIGPSARAPTERTEGFLRRMLRNCHYPNGQSCP